MLHDRIDCHDLTNPDTEKRRSNTSWMVKQWRTRLHVHKVQFMRNAMQHCAVMPPVVVASVQAVEAVQPRIAPSCGSPRVGIVHFGKSGARAPAGRTLDCPPFCSFLPSLLPTSHHPRFTPKILDFGRPRVSFRPFERPALCRCVRSARSTSWILPDCWSFILWRLRGITRLYSLLIPNIIPMLFLQNFVACPQLSLSSSELSSQ